FQRIFMYPIFFLSAISYVKKDFKQANYIICLAMIGLFISIYHNLLQFFVINNSCGRVSCTTHYIKIFGFITIPLLSLVSFVLITVICLYLIAKRKTSLKE
ncbi:disulfide bond formation protein B, partial [Heyndrickxia sporothermodurans]